jgi:ketosteroid isomerase-like protein
MTNRSIAMGALLLMLASAAPSALSAQIPDSVVPLQTVISETNRFRTEYAEYYNNKDVERLVGMYAADAILVNADGSMEVGQAAIKAYFTNGAPNFPHMVIKSDSLVAYGQTAVDVGTVTLHPKEGGELVNRYLVVLRRTYQAWHVVRVMVVPVK